jgi:WD40 repeat protein
MRVTHSLLFWFVATLIPVVMHDRAAISQDAVEARQAEQAYLQVGTHRFRAPDGVFAMELSPDGKTVVGRTGDQILAWDAASGEERWRADAPRLSAAHFCARALAFSSDSTVCYSIGEQGKIDQWNMLDGTKSTITFDTSNSSASQTFLDVTDDASRFVIGGSQGIVVCNRDGNILYVIRNHPEPIDDDQLNRDRLQFGGPHSWGLIAPDQKTIAALTSDTPDVVRIINLSDGAELRRIQLGAKLVRMAYAADGSRFVTTERDNSIRCYDNETGQRLWSHTVELNNPYENYTSAVDISHDGQWVVAGATDHRLYLLDASTGKQLAQLTGHAAYPWAVRFSADDTLIYSTGWDGKIRRWDTQSRKQLPVPNRVWATPVVTISPDGSKLVYADDRGSVRFVDTETKVETIVDELPQHNYSQLAFSGDGKLVACGGATDDELHLLVFDRESDKIIQHWNWPKGTDPHSSFEALHFSPQADTIAAVVFRQHTGFVWRLADGKQIAVLPHRSIYGCTYNPSGTELATVGWDKTLRTWEATSGKLLKEIAMTDLVKLTPAQQEDFRYDLRMYAVDDAAQNMVRAVAYLGGIVRLWRPETMEPIAEFQTSGDISYGALAVSSDGTLVVTGARNGAVELWDATDGSKVQTLGKHGSSVYTVGFTADQRFVVSGGDDGLCYLWEL